MTVYKRLFLMVSLTMMWSPSFLFIKLALQDLPPMTITILRVGGAAIFFLLLLYWRGVSLPKSRQYWWHASVMACFSSVLPFYLFCYAEQTIESALAAVLNGCTPIYTALLAQVFLPEDRLTLQKVLGISCSAGGVVLLFAPTLTQGITGTSVGMMAATAAALSYAISHVYAKKYITGQAPFIAPASQLVASTLILLPFTLYLEPVTNLSMPSLTAILGVCGLCFLGTVCAFTIYYRLMECSGPIAISTVACFFPVGGMLLGFLFLSEEFTWAGIKASALIFLGLALVNELVSLESLKEMLKKICKICQGSYVEKI